MTNIINSFINNSVQCWGCGVFDRLFQIVSTAATQMYEQLTFLAMITFVALFTALIVNAVYQNIKSGGNDPFYKKSILKVFINAIVVLGLLGAGVAVPKMVTRVTIEPAALVALTYTQALTQQDMNTVEEKVTYQPMEMADDSLP